MKPPPFFSAVARRVLRHGDFPSREDLIDKLDTYMINRNETAKPYRWTYDGTPTQGHVDDDEQHGY
ncbi:hypothetical protein [Actinacidiphila oryziradicis]|uniref:Transposase n=1 Tax=Actinacidiphila oryziradicis TaxID=2571141 RepID=A0A4U0RZU0_9ACTN|nr:hypothetical protein [Actinacidiphila oryziradicis]TKA01982.1 hypothetical protein FCI23_39620 [Actinacidiphila oryziradicis]